MARKRKVDDDDEDDIPKKKRRKAPIVDDDDDDDDSPPSPKKPSNNDAYTGLAILTFLGLVAACVIFYLDAEALGPTAPAAPNVTIPALGGQPAAANQPQPDA
jgi:hypothetical protein